MAQYNGTQSLINQSGIPLTSSGPAILDSNLIVRADVNNWGTVYVGYNSNLTAGWNDATDGYPLNAGEVIQIPPAALGQGPQGLYVIAQSGIAYNLKVHWIIAQHAIGTPCPPAQQFV